MDAGTDVGTEAGAERPPPLLPATVRRLLERATAPRTAFSAAASAGDVDLFCGAFGTRSSAMKNKQPEPYSSTIILSQHWLGTAPHLTGLLLYTLYS